MVEASELRKPGGVYSIEGPRSQLEVHNMMKDMGCLWFVANDKKDRVHVEWNLKPDAAHCLIQALEIMLKQPDEREEDLKELEQVELMKEGGFKGGFKEGE